MDTSDHHPVVIFDGICTLCNASVDFLMRNDTTSTLRFASLQGETARTLLASHGRHGEPESIIVVANGVLMTESTAVLFLLPYLRFPYPLLGVVRIVPRVLRDPVYRLIARNRYRWFGKRESCRLPTPAERSRFLE